MRKFGVLVLAASVVLPSALFAGDKVKIDQVPAPVRATIEKETKGGSVKEIERESKGGVKMYEVEYNLPCLAGSPSTAAERHPLR